MYLYLFCFNYLKKKKQLGSLLIINTICSCLSCSLFLCKAIAVCSLINRFIISFFRFSGISAAFSTTVFSRFIPPPGSGGLGFFFLTSASLTSSLSGAAKNHFILSSPIFIKSIFDRIMNSCLSRAIYYF